MAEHYITVMLTFDRLLEIDYLFNPYSVIIVI